MGEYEEQRNLTGAGARSTSQVLGSAGLRASEYILPETYEPFGARLRRAVSEGVLLGVKYGLASIFALGLWAATGYWAWSKVATSVIQAQNGQIAHQYLSTRYEKLDKMLAEHDGK